MATPRYVAKKVGDQYVLERKDAVGCCKDAVWTTAGGLMALCGLARRGPCGWLAVAGGAAMAYRGITGRNPLARLFKHDTRRQDDPGPSHQNDARPTAQAPEDDIDEAVMESFPASDPPARGGVTTVGGASAS